MARVVVLALALASCRQLPELIANTCGNGVVEPKEDCDLYSEFQGNTKCTEFCRYSCDFYGVDPNSPSCPVGRECGRDNLCRLPSGKYTMAASSPLSFEATELLVGDLDGDSSADLIGGTPDLIDIRYGSGDGTFRESFALSIDTPNGDRALGDVDGNGVQDLLVPYLLGVNAFLGDRARRLIPDAHPQLELSDFLSTQGVKDVRFLVGQVGGGFNSATAFGVWTDGRDLNVTFDRMDSAIVRVPAEGERIVSVAVEDFTDGPDDELIVAIEGEPRLWLGKLRCDANCGIGEIGAETGTITLTAIELGGFGAIEPLPVHFLDVDGDRIKDILAVAEGNEGPQALFFRGNGTSFDPPEEDFRFRACLPGCWPLAAASQEGTPLFVFSEGILSSTVAGGELTPLYLSMPATWTQASIADFDGDGTLDVVAADDTSPSVAFLFRAGPRAFNRIDVPLPIAPRHLASGDFDGDGVYDLAAVLERDFDEIHVVFGETSGPPTDAAFMARFANIAHIQSTFFLSPAPWNPDLVHDLIVEVSSTEGAIPEHAAILVGTGRRRLHSPIPLFADEGDRPRFGSPHHVRIGQLDGDSGADLMTLTLEGEIWLLRNRERARFMTGDIKVWSSSVAMGLCGFPVRERPEGCGTIEVGPIRDDDTRLDDAILADRSALCPDQPGPIGLGLITTAGACRRRSIP